MIKQCLAVNLTVPLLFFISSDTFAITADLNPAKDNTLYEDINGSLSNGAGIWFFAGTNLSADVRRGLIMFDIAGEIPSSASITGASLTLSASRVANTVPDSIELRRVGSDWGEAGSVAVGGGGGQGGGGSAQNGDATWLHSFSPSTSWSNPGGDFSNVVSASTNVGDVGSYTWSSAQLASDVQDMFESPQNNFGWILLGNEAFGQTAKRFDTRESSNPPILAIEYDLPGGSPDADFDDDDDVDRDDLDDWASDYGSGNIGDADGDGDTDGADYIAWQQQHTGPAGIQISVVPEPSSAALALSCLALTALNRRRRASRCENGQK